MCLQLGGDLANGLTRPGRHVSLFLRAACIQTRKRHTRATLSDCSAADRLFTSLFGGRKLERGALNYLHSIGGAHAAPRGVTQRVLLAGRAPTGGQVIGGRRRRAGRLHQLVGARQGAGDRRRRGRVVRAGAGAGVAHGGVPLGVEARDEAHPGRVLLAQLQLPRHVISVSIEQYAPGR